MLTDRSFPAPGGPHPGDRATVSVLIGSPGAGKSQALVAVMDTVQHHDLDVVVAGASPELLHQYQRTAVGRPTQRTAARFEVEEPQAGACEVLRLHDGQAAHLIEAWAGEDRHVGGATDVPALLDRLEDRGAHRVVLCTNPFRDSPPVAEWALFEMAWMWQERGSGFALSSAVVETARRLWGVTEKGLARLYAPWPRLAKDLAGARLVRQPLARFGRPVADAFRVEGVTAERAAAVVTGLRRVAQIVAALAEPDVRLVRELARAWHDTVALVTHAGYLAYLPGLSHGDLREYGCSLYPNPAAARMGQVITQESLDLTLTGDPDDPVWVEGPRPEAHDLLAAIRRPPLALPLSARRPRRTRPRPRPSPADTGSCWGFLRGPVPWAVLAGIVALVGVTLVGGPWAGLVVLVSLLLVGAGALLAGMLSPAPRPARAATAAPPRPAAVVPPAVARRARPAAAPPNGRAEAGATE
jgi:hypothetical protein